MTQSERLAQEVAETLGQKGFIRYLELLEKGNTPKFAHMLVFRSPPGTGTATDRVFNEVYRRVMDKMKPQEREGILEVARKNGINPEGKYYTGIGRYADKESWASTSDDVVAGAKALGKSAHGPGVEYEPPTKVNEGKPLSDQVMKRFRRQYQATEPDITDQEIVRRHAVTG